MSRFKAAAVHGSPAWDGHQNPMRPPVATMPSEPAKTPPPPVSNISQRATPFGLILMVFGVLLLANHLGRPFEHVLVGLRIPAVICGLGILVAVFFALSAFRTKAGKAMALLVCWMLLIIPLSTWKGGSATYMLSYIKFWVVLFMILACGPKTFRQLSFLANTTAIAAIVNIYIAGRFDTQERFNMEGTFGNSDDAAILAGFAIPFWLFFSSRFHPFIRPVLALAGTAFLLRIIILTATRSILISLACLFMVWLVRRTMAQRAIAIVLMVAAAGLLLATAPQSVRDRLATTFDAFSTTRENATSDEASYSAAERRELLKDGILTTLSHPIWGVGPGQFAQYRWSALSKPGEVKRSFKTHNTYVQMSAENGIPSLLLYLVVIWATFKTISRARKASATQSSPGLAVAFQLASCMELALAFFAVTALFMTIEAHPYLFILAGLAAANERLVQAELTRMQPPVQPSLPSGRWGPTFVGGA